MWVKKKLAGEAVHLGRGMTGSEQQRPDECDLPGADDRAFSPDFMIVSLSTRPVTQLTGSVKASQSLVQLYNNSMLMSIPGLTFIALSAFNAMLLQCCAMVKGVSMRWGTGRPRRSMRWFSQ